MDEDQRWARADDDTSPEVTVARGRTSTDVDPGPPPATDEPAVIDDPDATEALRVSAESATAPPTG
ncbi:MAG: hypothetical protein H0U89_07515, partial [Acidimicrobiia bacterium]|nr:hypothetical protein [Acidimicrobiia bacterium]